MCPFTYHRLEVSANNEHLFIRKKTSLKPDEIATLWDAKLEKSKSLLKFLRINPDLNHLRFYWKDCINYKIVNPGVKCDWPYPEEATVKSRARMNAIAQLMQGIREWYLSARRMCLSQNKRNSKINIFDFIRCPTCRSDNLAPPFFSLSKQLYCLNCDTTYKISEGVPKLFPANIDEFNKSRINS